MFLILRLKNFFFAILRLVSSVGHLRVPFKEPIVLFGVIEEIKRKMLDLTYKLWNVV